MVEWIDEDDDWQTGRPTIIDEGTLSSLKALFEETPVIVEHCFYHGARSPDRFVFEDCEDFKEYLDKNARPGDHFNVWRFDLLCRLDNTILASQYPDSRGRVPRTGAY